MIKLFRFGLLMITIFLMSVLAQNKVSNRIEAFIVDEDTTGTNVRETPAGKVKQVLHLKDRCRLATSIIIYRYSGNGWFYIETADECVEKAKGWVHSSLIFTAATPSYSKIGGEVYGKPVFLQEKPNRESAKVAKLIKIQYVNILNCENQWVYVKAKDDKGKLVYGWLSPEDQCSNPFTSCN